MDEAASSGRTVLFVTHDLAAATRLCTRAVWLRAGRIARMGDARDVTAAYLADGEAAASRTWMNPAPREGRTASILWARVGEEEDGVLGYHDPVRVRIAYVLEESIPGFAVFIRVLDARGNILFTSWDTDMAGREGHARSSGTYVSACTIPPALLAPGRYALTLGAHRPGVEVIDSHEAALSFELSPVGYPLNRGRPGLVAPLLAWSVARDSGVDGKASGAPERRAPS
jgi:lipopolysaccharide transport system ATP-binding protein